MKLVPLSHAIAKALSGGLALYGGTPLNAAHSTSGATLQITAETAAPFGECHATSGGSLVVSVPILPDIPITKGPIPLTFSERFSSPILEQNQAPTGNFTLVDYPGGYSYYQDFYLPKDFVRGPEDTTARVPSLTGFQLFTTIAIGYEDLATVDYIIERYESGAGWQTLSAGTATGSDLSGAEVWFTAYIDPVDIDPGQIDDRYRLGIRGRDPSIPIFKDEVEYQGGRVLLGTVRYPVALQPGVPYHIDVDGVPNVLYQDDASRRVYRSTESGVLLIHASTPNPLITTSSKAFDSDGTTPLTIDGDETSFLFRILANTAEGGTDFLGDKYRSIAVRNTVENTSTLDSEVQDRFWLSRPNPSKFAVESLYFDLSGNQDAPVTVDRIFLDPLTPGVYFNVYWSSDGDPATSDTEWENKLWNHVPLTFHLRKKDTYALPQPVTARYMKVEFTELQPKWYAPGTFQKTILYKKHPKWVLDFFLLRILAQKHTHDPFVPAGINVAFRALELAFSYYLDDLHQKPLKPQDLGIHGQNELAKFLTERSDDSDKVDWETTSNINAATFPFTRHISTQGTDKYLPALYSRVAGSTTLNGRQIMNRQAPVERWEKFAANKRKVSSKHREKILHEKEFPVMFFFVSCRHKYRVVSATLEEDRAYFAGVREIAFMRDHYAVAFDNDLYVDHAGDNLNMERNDLELVDLTWQTYKDIP